MRSQKPRTGCPKKTKNGMYVNWARIEGSGDVPRAWEGDYKTGDRVNLDRDNAKGHVLVRLVREEYADAGFITRHWVAAPEQVCEEQSVPEARRCLLCGDVAASSDLKCGCHEGCTDANVLAFLCMDCLEADTDGAALVREHVQRASFVV